MDVWIAGIVFVVAYALIAFEPFDRTLIALAAALVVIVLGVIDQHEAFAAIDLNVIFLLAGMMVIAGILAKTGLFDWIAVRSLRLSKGRPVALLLILSTVTALLSAFLDNVTTVVLIVPVIITIARRLGVSPVPYLIAMILASNIGGTATLIGDPPNILIGSAAGLDFTDFLVNLAPVTVVIYGAFVVIAYFAWRRHLEVPSERREAAVEATEGATITDPVLLTKGLVVSAFVLVGFLVHQALGLEAATIALLGATVLMIVGRIDAHDAFREVEWRTLFFFVGLFILVAAVVHVGIIDGIANNIAERTQGNETLASMTLLWFSAGASAVIDNIPYTATAIPIVERLIETGLPSDALWWSLALGACLGGNLTLVGAAANVVVANSASQAGHRIGFFEFMRYGVVVTLASLLIATIYVWLRYLQ
jgi:Na+/H+ antiporter NhaD/arsenite permease-like protein